MIYGELVEGKMQYVGRRPTKEKRECNRHVDCDAADHKAFVAGGVRADHCYDDCCEECFGC